MYSRTLASVVIRKAKSCYSAQLKYTGNCNPGAFRNRGVSILSYTLILYIRISHILSHDNVMNDQSQFTKESRGSLHLKLWKFLKRLFLAWTLRPCKSNFMCRLKTPDFTINYSNYTHHLHSNIKMKCILICLCK